MNGVAGASRNPRHCAGWSKPGLAGDFTRPARGHKIVPVATVNQTTHALTLQLLEWISAHPRTYDETLDAWRTSCPRLSIWEDACIDGLIEIAPGGRIVAVSPKGKSLLGSEPRSGRSSPASREETG